MAFDNQVDSINMNNDIDETINRQLKRLINKDFVLMSYFELYQKFFF